MKYKHKTGESTPAEAWPVLYRTAWSHQLPHTLYSWLFISMQCISCLHGIVLMNCNSQVLFWKYHRPTNCSLVYFGVEYCCSAPGHVPNELILFFLKDCVPGFLTSICTNAALLQLQFLCPSEAYFQFSHRIINETQTRYGPRMEYLSVLIHPSILMVTTVPCGDAYYTFLCHWQFLLYFMGML